LARSSEVPAIAAVALIEPISPELVLVDPELAAVERPREFAVRVIAREVVPLGTPLVPRAPAAARPAWLVGVIGVCLLATGLLVSLLLFGGSSTGPNRPTVVVSTALAPPPGIRIPSVGLPTPPP